MYYKGTIDSLLTKVDKLINEDCNVDHTNSVIKVNDVIEAISQIKHGKKDGYSLIYTDHFINGTNKLYIMLSLLFSSMIVHGFSPDGLNISTIQPLVKKINVNPLMILQIFVPLRLAAQWQKYLIGLYYILIRINFVQVTFNMALKPRVLQLNVHLP